MRWVLYFCLACFLAGCGTPETYCIRKSRIASERWTDKGYQTRVCHGFRSEMDCRKHALKIPQGDGSTNYMHRWTEVLIDGKWLVADDGKPPVWTAKELEYVG